MFRFIRRWVEQPPVVEHPYYAIRSSINRYLLQSKRGPLLALGSVIIVAFRSLALSLSSPNGGNSLIVYMVDVLNGVLLGYGLHTLLFLITPSIDERQQLLQLQVAINEHDPQGSHRAEIKELATIGSAGGQTRTVPMIFAIGAILTLFGTSIDVIFGQAVDTATGIGMLMPLGISAGLIMIGGMSVEIFHANVDILISKGLVLFPPVKSLPEPPPQLKKPPEATAASPLPTKQPVAPPAPKKNQSRRKGKR